MINHQVSNKKVYETTNYSLFKYMETNRDVDTVKKLTDSFRKYGFIGGSVLVNEKMEVIDGQHRIHVCETLGIPVYYEIIPGATIEHCRALNINQKNWTTKDFVESYATEGNDTYKWVLELSLKYPSISLDNILGLAYSSGKTMSNGGTDAKDRIIHGLLDVDDDVRLIVEENLEYCSHFTEYVKIIKGRAFLIYNAILRCKRWDFVDDDRLLHTVFAKRCHKMAEKSNLATMDILKNIEDEYNKGLSKGISTKRVYLVEAYKREKDMGLE